jgi:hypothetical protein
VHVRTDAGGASAKARAGRHGGTARQRAHSASFGASSSAMACPIANAAGTRLPGTGRPAARADATAAGCGRRRRPSAARLCPRQGPGAGPPVRHGRARRAAGPHAPPRGQTGRSGPATSCPSTRLSSVRGGLDLQGERIMPPSSTARAWTGSRGAEPLCSGLLLVACGSPPVEDRGLPSHVKR